MPPTDWVPGDDPFPEDEIVEFRNFEWQSKLQFIRHHEPPVSAPDSLWQLLEDFTVQFDMVDARGHVSTWSLTAPRGMYSDLASVPDILWSIFGPIGPTWRPALFTTTSIWPGPTSAWTKCANRTGTSPTTGSATP